MNPASKPTEASRLNAPSYLEQVFNNVLRSRQDSVSSTGSSSDAEDLERWLWQLKSQEELEAAGEVSDCMYHVAKGGTHGPTPRLRMFLPALNKVLCSNRVSQMTKTYNDIEAVTRLLEEKEKDIELTARIGKELLSHNQKLETNVASLETELRTANEKITQLSHELQKKTELIQILTNDYDDSGSEAGTPTGQINFEVLQRRVCRLEEENTSLRHEASQLAAATEDCELQEAKLVADLATQLALARTDLSGITLDADQQRQEAIDNKMRCETLTQKLSSAEIKIAMVTSENDELVSMINIARETQCELATELADMKEKYAEVMNLLQEAQEGLRRQRKKTQPQARGGLLFPSLHTSLPMHNPDSLAAELECSLFSELSLDSGIGASSTNVPNYKKVFETVRCASRTSSLGSGSSTGSSPGHGPRYLPMGNSVLSNNNYPSLSNTMPLSVSSSQRPRISSSFATSRPPLMRSNYTALDSAGASDSESSEDFTYMSRGVSDQAPAASDLEAALRRLTPSAVAARRAALGSGPGDHDFECRTPDSIMSTGSSGAFSGGMSWKLPDKLQIVKPIEGSVTLHHWSELATPSLGGLLEERPGVKVRGGTELEALGLELYTLSDLEEDDEVIHPGKSFQDTGSIYTFTNSTVMHPDDNTSVTHSLRGSQMCTASSSRMSTAAPTPVHRSRRNSTSTYSTALGLAKMLNERGIKAVTPSTLPTPMFSPTATPANSPDHSPSSSPESSRSPSPSPYSATYSPLGLPGFLMSSGAELLRRTLVGSTQKQSQHRSRRRTKPESSALVPQNQKAGLTGIRLVETLERIGLERIMSTTPSPTPPIDKGVLSQPRPQPTSSVSTTGTLPTSTVVKPITPLGVPGRPGSGALESRLSQIPCKRLRQPRLRPDLGTVPGKTDSSTASSSLGTLSSMLFGRKGGLL